MFKLRDYQQRIVDSAIKHMQESIDYSVIEAATGAGKSLVIAELAKWVHKISGKRVLCLAPIKELVEQNAEKYRTYDLKCSLFSASLNQKSLRHYVVFGSPMTVKNQINRFKGFAAVFIDECHQITPTIKTVIEALKKDNPKLRVIGLSATPYRLASGYIYELDENGKKVEETKDPYFKKLLCSVQTQELLDKGYLTPVTTEVHQGYEAGSLQLQKNGLFNAADVDRVFVGQGRLTSNIVQEVVELSHNRKGVMFFAATVQHAQEIMESLDPQNSRLITGDTDKNIREQSITAFKNQRFKYLVNVSVLTTGFDAPHVDVIAILRATESASLLQQIIGRGLRLNDNKNDCLVLDYADNIDRHCPDGDIFKPIITATKHKKKGVEIECACPSCGGANKFSARENKEKLNFNSFGYFTDLAGNQTEMPAHHGRRCENYELSSGVYQRCEYRWTFKECEKCGHDNDIASRYCSKCKAEIIDPNEKLKLEYQRIKSKPSELSTDKVLAWSLRPYQAKSLTLKIDFTTEYRTFPIWFSPKKVGEWKKLCLAFGVSPSVDVYELFDKLKNQEPPKTISARKEPNGFYKIYGYNEVEDEIPEMA